MEKFEPVVFEKFFIENWESFKKWRTKGFYTIFTTSEHEWISVIDFEWLIVIQQELSHLKTTRWLVNYERKSFRPNFIIQTIALIWNIWEKPIRPIRYQLIIAPPTTAKVSTWLIFLSRNTVFLSDRNRFRMANGLLYRLFEEVKDWIIGFIHPKREHFLWIKCIYDYRLVNLECDPTKRNWEAKWRAFVLLERLASSVRWVLILQYFHNICSGHYEL